MAKATVRSKSGTLVTIEGSESEVSSILSAIERNAVVGRAKEVIGKNQAIKKTQKKRATASDLIIELKENGFFDKPKSLSEVASGLENQGFIYPVTTLSGVVLGLVQKKLLGRKKVDGKWAYGK